MTSFVEGIEALFEAIEPRRDSDATDRLNYCVTTSVLIIAAGIIFGWEFCGTPITCWFPAYYTDHWREYAEDYCYVQNTYVQPMTEFGKPANATQVAQTMSHIPRDIYKREEKMIPYYQWVPFFLAVQALAFYLPIVIWRSLNSQYGICTDTILTTAHEATSMSDEERESNLKRIASFLYHGMFIEGQTSSNRAQRRYRESHLCVIFIAVKLLSFVNSVTQFALLGAFLDYEWNYGYTVLEQMARGLDWREFGHFPRVTMCDFSVKMLGNVHRHSVQCVLMINMFSEKIFLFLWWWYLFMIAVNLISLVSWISIVMLAGSDHSLLQMYRDRLGEPERSKRWFGDFYKSALHADGLFILKLIQSNSGDSVGLDVFVQMWKEYLNDEGNKWGSKLTGKQQTEV